MLIISQKSCISKLADIEDSVRGSKIAIDEGVIIDSFVKIKPAGGSGDVHIGAHSVINSGTVIYSGNGVKIGKRVAIAANCTLAPTNHEIRERGKWIMDQGFMTSRGGILIEDDVWIGANAVLLDGAILRHGCIVGAGTVVRGELQAFSINVGVPSRRIGFRQ
ncbi:MAG TPA: acyltransferase [Alphaproteobacteria bacterium]|nr:acyltransferase [Alphaproteobacteria bacterium]